MIESNRNKIYYIFTVIGSMTILFACHNNQYGEQWFDETKSEILEQGSLKADSIVLTFNEDSSYKTEHYFHDGDKYLLKGYYDGKLRVEIHYANGNDFELRREVCDDRTYGFEGIFYFGKAYGPSTWRNCENNNVSAQGI